MKPSEYIPYGTLHNVKDLQLREILDYCDRYIDCKIEYLDYIPVYEIRLSNGILIDIMIRFGWYVNIDGLGHDICSEIFYDNYKGIIGTLKNMED